MGNDGGSIPKRSEVIKQKKKKQKISKDGQGLQLCSMTKEKLRLPLVACKRGLIYNKEGVIKRMLEKSMPHEFRHIKKLSNLVSLSARSFDANTHQLCCAITRTELSDCKPFQVNDCGCVISVSAL